MPAIELHNISKAYRLGQADPTGRSFREAVVDTLAAPIRRLRQLGEATGDDAFWALRDVSFEIEEGEVVGLIGRNGAGKSTLLKVLSRIVEPTSGRAILRGRVGSLLEVGTGFHPELTGRENIYLNGAILGMRKKEIDRKFDEIVAFAEIEKFLDTAVKRYSSGMYVRLAFAVAAHLDPEILIVDEVLAVGDAQFQKKCLGKMGEVAKSGRTVVFVSHNMAVVRSLCETACLLDHGRVEFIGSVEEAIAQYAGNGDVACSPTIVFAQTADSPRMVRATLHVNGAPSNVAYYGDELTIEVEFGSDHPVSHPKLGYVITTADGEHVVAANNRFQSGERRDYKPATGGNIRCELGKLPLMAGRYFISLWLGNHNSQDTHVARDALTFDVNEQDIWGEGMLPPRNVARMWWPSGFAVTNTPDCAGSGRD